MDMLSLDHFPDDARLWVFAANEALTDEQSRPLLEHVRAFVERWTAHGRPVTGAFDWRDGRFLLVAADERASQVSGCSIDSLFHTLQQVEKEAGIPLTDRTPIWFRDATGAIQAKARPEFRRLMREGAVNADTSVFDNTVATVGDVRGGRWELPLRDSWHARVFGLRASELLE